MAADRTLPERDPAGFFSVKTPRHPRAKRMQLRDGQSSLGQWPTLALFIFKN